MPNPFEDLQQLLEWRTRGENCPICDSLRGRVYTYDMWMSAGVWPGFHINCDCYLKKVGEVGGEEVVISDPDFFGTDLNLLSRTINPNIGWLKFHLDPNYLPFSWYMTQQITEAHITYGADRPISDVIKLMRSDWQGFFKRSTFFDNFFVWRVFKTIQHYSDINDTWLGTSLGERLGFRKPIIYQPAARTGSTFKRYSQFAKYPSLSEPAPIPRVVSPVRRYRFPYHNLALKPLSLKPYYPYQTYSRGSPFAYPH